VFGYYFKLYDRWTPALHWSPRWLQANGYPTLFDSSVNPPVSGTLSVLNPTPASAQYVPSSWQLAAFQLPAVSGSTLQAITEVFTGEIEYLKPALINLSLLLSRTYDVSEIEFVWVVNHDQPIQQLEIQLSSGQWVEISPALGMHDLLQAESWKWLGSDNSAVISGLDVFEYQTNSRVDSWQFVGVDLASSMATTSIQYFEHPSSRQWIPVHPLQIRQTDGFLGFYSTQSRTRFRIPYLSAALSGLRVRVNGQVETTATPSQPWTSLDERGLWMNADRIWLETNQDFAERLFILSRVQGQTTRSLQSTLSAQLGTATRQTFSTAASSLVYDPTSTGYQVHNYGQYVYVTEVMVPDVTSTTIWKSRYQSPELGCMFLNGQKLDHSQVSASGSLWSVDKTANNKNDVLIARWRIQLWGATSSGLNLTQNFPGGVEELTVINSAKVQVLTNPSTTTSRRSFIRTSPVYRWSNTPLPTEALAGLAVFN